MTKQAIECSRYIDDEEINGILSLKTDHLHFEATLPNKHRFILPLHKILGLTKSEKHCLLFLTDSGIIYFYGQRVNLDEFIIQIRAAQNTINSLHQSRKSISLFVQAQTGKLFKRNPCSLYLSKESIVIYVRDEAPETIFLNDIQEIILMGSYRRVRLTTAKETRFFFGSEAIKLYAMLTIMSDPETHGGEITNTWTDQFKKEGKISWKAFVIQTSLKLHIYPINPFQGFRNTQPLHLDTAKISVLEFQNEHLRFQIMEHTMYLSEHKNLGFYRKVCENLCRTQDFYFDGAWSSISRDIPLEEVHGERVLCNSASWWQDTRKIIQGCLLLDGENLHFVPFYREMDDITFPLNELTRDDDSMTPADILKLRTREDSFTFLCSDDRFAPIFHERTRLPTRLIYWKELPLANQKKLMHQQRAILQYRETQVMVQLNLIIDELVAHRITQKGKTPRSNEKVHIHFNTSGGRYSFDTSVKLQDITDPDNIYLKSPERIALVTEREAARHSVGKDIQLLLLEHQEENDEWLPTSAPLSGVLIDISEKGCGVSLQSNNIGAERILIEIDTEPVIQLYGQILHQEFYMSGGLRLGIRFIESSTDLRSRIRQAIQHFTTEREAE